MENVNDPALNDADNSDAQELVRVASIGARPVDAALMMLASAMKLQFADEPAAQRAIDRAVVYLQSTPIYEFDGVELRVVSLSRRSEGVIYVCDGHTCTCQGRWHPWCYHRALFRLLFAQWAMREPGYVRAQILRRHAPSTDGYDEFGDFLSQPMAA